MKKHFALVSIAFLVSLLVSCQRDTKPVVAPSSDGSPAPTAESKRDATPSLAPVSPQRTLFAPAPSSPIPFAGGPGNVALGDLNQDGKPDLVVATGRDRSITMLLGQGDGQFREVRGSPLKLPQSPSEMLLRDLNGDGKLDLAIASHESYGVMLLLGDGNGGLVLAPNSPIVMKEGERPHTHGLLAGDLNVDGKPDLVTVNSDPDNNVSVAFGDGSGGFARAPSSPFAVGPSPYPSALGDLNGDGHLDIITTTTDRSKSQDPASRALTVLLGDGRGNFRQSQISLRTLHPWFVIVADVNGDGKSDLVATHTERSELSVLLGDGKGGFAETTGSPFDLGAPAWHAAIWDVNRDGWADLIATGSGLRVMLGDGRGGFQPAPGSPFTTGRGTWRLAFGDVNGDGKPDVATSNLESDTVSILLAQ